MRNGTVRRDTTWTAPRIILACATAAAAAADATIARAEDKPDSTRWYERLDLGGYAQIRYDRLLVAGDATTSTDTDPALAPPARFSLRRARIKLEGDVHERLYLYIQPELAGSVGEAEQIVELRDLYGDIALVRDKSVRVRAGLSKVPYGFENMQSSQDRAPFERSDALNSAVPNERDLGVYVMFAPAAVRRRFATLSKTEYKGCGDYGMVTLGVFNGQTANKGEENANKHVIARLARPFDIGSQTIELGLGGYTGRFVTIGGATGARNETRDVRAHATFVLYPKPIGLQMEYNVGVGPEREGEAVVERPLGGGYAMLLARIGPTHPYLRFVHYDGSWKSLSGRPRRRVDELELGVEWRVAKFLELTAAYVETHRAEGDDPQRAARFVRAQLQLDY